MLKKFLVLSMIMFIATRVYALGNADFSGIISDSNINKSGLSVTIMNLESGKEEYRLHSKRPVNPASVQKLVTYKISESVLGKDYKLETKLYKNSDNEYIIKLGADPLLTSDDLKTLVKNIDTEVKAIYIDDTIVDDIEWGEGWQWDDDLNPLMPKFSAYNLDGNLVKINFEPTTSGAPANITQEKFYPLSFVNQTVTGKENRVSLSRKNYIAPDMITATGTVNTLMSKKIPINNMKLYFKLSLERILVDADIDNSGVYRSKKVTSDYEEVASITHSMADVAKVILVNSNNTASESLFKIASSKHSGVGSFAEGHKLLVKYCKKNKINIADVKIVDASGVSKNNMLTGEFITEFLANPANSDLKELLPKANQGTLKNRMLYMKDNLHAKTGTLANTSAIAGYVDTLNGNTYAFCIMINDPKSKNSDKKMLEEYLIREIYTKL